MKISHVNVWKVMDGQKDIVRNIHVITQAIKKNNGIPLVKKKLSNRPRKTRLKRYRRKRNVCKASVPTQTLFRSSQALRNAPLWYLTKIRRTITKTKVINSKKLWELYNKEKELPEKFDLYVQRKNVEDLTKKILLYKSFYSWIIQYNNCIMNPNNRNMISPFTQSQGIITEQMLDNIHNTSIPLGSLLTKRRTKSRGRSCDKSPGRKKSTESHSFNGKVRMKGEDSSKNAILPKLTGNRLLGGKSSPMSTDDLDSFSDESIDDGKGRISSTPTAKRVVKDENYFRKPPGSARAIKPSNRLNMSYGKGRAQHEMKEASHEYAGAPKGASSIRSESGVVSQTSPEDEESNFRSSASGLRTPTGKKLIKSGYGNTTPADNVRPSLSQSGGVDQRQASGFNRRLDMLRQLADEDGSDQYLLDQNERKYDSEIEDLVNEVNQKHFNSSADPHYAADYDYYEYYYEYSDDYTPTQTIDDTKQVSKPRKNIQKKKIVKKLRSPSLSRTAKFKSEYNEPSEKHDRSKGEYDITKKPRKVKKVKRLSSMKRPTLVSSDENPSHKVSLDYGNRYSKVDSQSHSTYDYMSTDDYLRQTDAMLRSIEMGLDDRPLPEYKRASKRSGLYEDERENLDRTESNYPESEEDPDEAIHPYSSRINAILSYGRSDTNETSSRPTIGESKDKTDKLLGSDGLSSFNKTKFVSRGVQSPVKADHSREGVIEPTAATTSTESYSLSSLCDEGKIGTVLHSVIHRVGKREYHSKTLIQNKNFLRNKKKRNYKCECYHGICPKCGRIVRNDPELLKTSCCDATVISLQTQLDNLRNLPSSESDNDNKTNQRKEVYTYKGIDIDIGPSDDDNLV